MTEPHERMDLPDEVIVYGAGGFGRRLVDSLQSGGVTVTAIADRVSGLGYDGIPATTPEIAVASGLPIMLGISNPGTDAAGLSDWLIARGAPAVWSPVQCSIALARCSVVLENYWMTGDLSVYSRAADMCLEARQCLVDERSKLLFDAILDYRTNGHLDVLPAPDPLQKQYAPSDLLFLEDGMRLVDAGAFDGDTVRTVLDSGYRVEGYLALEPDPANFESLVKVLRSTGWREGLAAPLALSDRTETLRFEASGTGSAAVSDSGSVSVQAVAWDHLAPNWAPTHVKMDIEGAESAALMGMRDTLVGARPKLAISVYHRPEDLWEIQRWVSELDVGYRFWLRCYGHQTFDTVLYCVAE